MLVVFQMPFTIIVGLRADMTQIMILKNKPKVRMTNSNVQKRRYNEITVTT